MLCPICEHTHRADMESALLAGQTIKMVAEYFDVSPIALKKHRNTCATYVMSLEEFDKEVAQELRNMGDHDAAEKLIKPSSIQRQLGLKEADILAGTVNEYMVTLKNLGRKINRIVENMDDAEGALLAVRVLKKPICDMYVNLGGEIRQTVRTMAELDKIMNGPEESLTTGLQALSLAIRNSSTPEEQQ